MILPAKLRQQKRAEIQKARKPLLEAKRAANEKFRLSIATMKVERAREIDEADEKFEAARAKIVLKYDKKAMAEAKKLTAAGRGSAYEAAA